MPSIDVEDDCESCEWIVERAKTQLARNDRPGAKSWILTAKSLFPSRFIVQYEAFQLHLLCNELSAASQSLLELCSKFAKEEKTQELVRKVMDAIGLVVGRDQKAGHEMKEEEKKQMREMFDLLPNASRKVIFVKTAEGASDSIQKGLIVVATLTLFPETTTTLGLDCYDHLTESSRSVQLVADNIAKELLVSDLIPLLAMSPGLILEQPFLRSNGQSLILKTSHVCQWLEVAASYYTSLTVQALLSRKPHPNAGPPSWKNLNKVFLSVADKCGWMDIVRVKHQISPHHSSKMRWLALQKLSGYSPLARTPFDPPRGVAIGCFYISVFLFFESAWAYFSHLYQQDSEGEIRCWALVEDLSDTDERPPVKKRKLEEPSDRPTLHLQAGSRHADLVVQESFMVAVDCWNFLQSNNTYRGEFTRLCQQWGAHDWSWLAAFRADMALYKGELEIFRKLLQQERQRLKSSEKDRPANLRLLLQLVNAYVLLGDSKAACSLATELIHLVPDDAKERTPPPVSSSDSGRHLRLVGCYTADVLPFTIGIITNIMKELALSESSTSDLALGQLMVLLQYSWPKEMETFSSLLATIRKRGSFTYSKFFNYITIVEMLEEMLYLTNQPNMKINILASQEQGSNTRSRAVTRGSNSKAKEELMVAMEKQLLRCSEPVEETIKTFFKTEKLFFN